MRTFLCTSDSDFLEMSDMDPRIRNNSDELMLELKQAVAGERSTPDHMMLAAKAAFAWRGVDEELELLSGHTTRRLRTWGRSGVPLRLLRGCWFSTANMSRSNSSSAATFSWARSCRLSLIASSSSPPMGTLTRPIPTTPASSPSVARLGPVRLRCKHRDMDVVTEWMPIDGHGAHRQGE